MKIIILEAGHGRSWWGGYDPGAVHKTEKGIMTERDYTVLIAREVEKLLKDKYEVITVGVETQATRRKKLRYINKVIFEKKDFECVAVSIHVNAHKRESANGFEVWHNSDKGDYNLAMQILEKMKITGLRNRGLKEEKKLSRSYTRFMRCDACLVECGFLSNYNDRKFLYENWKQWARYIAEGIDNFIS